jgi:hypothetical protein
MNNRSLNSKQDIILNMIRKENKKRIYTCHHCKKKAIEINAESYQIIFVCKDHFNPKPDIIILNDMPGVYHAIYPSGLKLDKKALDPRVGGWHKEREDF